MTEKQRLVQEFMDNEGFSDRIVIGMYDGKRICFYIDFSDELANGLITMAMVDDNVHLGLKQLHHNIGAILEKVGDMKPETNEAIH